MFRLLRYFSLTSLVLIVLAAVSLGMLYRYVALGNLLQQGERNNVALAVALSNATRTEFGALLIAPSATPDTSQVKVRLDTLNSLVRNYTRGLSVVKVKVYDTRGRTVYSSEAKQIGEDKSGNTGYQAALAGRPSSELTHRGTFSAFEQTIENRDLLSSYVPVWRDDVRQVQAVFEIYDDVTPLLAQLAATQRQITGGVVLVLGVLYGILFLIVRHADRILRDQHAAQLRHEDELLAVQGQLEQRVQARTVELERANAAKSQFLANMSHEIRTPMSAVLGLSELLTLSGLTGKSLQYAQGIYSSATSLLELINDILDVTRIDAGQLTLAHAKFAPRELQEQVRAMLQPAAEAKGLQFRTSIGEDVPPALMGDAGRLRQIMINLAGNAIKFTDRGRVDMEIHAEPASAPGQVGLRMVFRDTGIGIDPEQLAGLFERFVQADDSNTRRHGGAGLGLYIVRELSLRMGGGVGVDSLPGVGSCFEVKVQMALPDAVPPSLSAGPDTASAAATEPAMDRASVTSAPAPHGAALPTPSREATSHRALSILLVEDNDINRMVARAMLEGAGHRVSEADNGERAVARHATERFDCILMDIHMPVLGGIAATRQIRTQEEARDLPRTAILALTANTMQGDRERFLAADMDAFLAKPYESADLLAALTRAMLTAQRANA